MTLLQFELAAATGLGGLLLGLAYFAALKRSVAVFVDGCDWRVALALSVARIGIAAALFFLLARIGAVALLSGAAGFLLARAIAINRARRAR